jgi:hypothetical protein
MPTCGEIMRAVSEYNVGQTFNHALELKAVLCAVQSLPTTPGRFLAEVCVVADWGSIRLDGFPFGDRIALAREIANSWHVLQPMQSWCPENWDAETALCIHAVELLSHTHLLPTPDAKRQLSFLSKYLHWCVNEAFPIWDMNARKALRDADDDRSWESYRKWLTKIRNEASRHKVCCLGRVQLSGENLVRTFDKALYIIGAERPAVLSSSRRNRERI